MATISTVRELLMLCELETTLLNAEVTLSTLVAALERSRGGLLGMLKTFGVSRMPDRQCICNALSKALREDRVSCELGEVGSTQHIHADEQVNRKADPNEVAFAVYDDGLTATAIMASQWSSVRKVHAKLDAIGSRLAPPPASSVTVVGAGVAGLNAALELDAPSRDLVVLERTDSIGGVWRHYANAYSRVNSSEPSYRAGGAGALTNHTPTVEVLNDVMQAIRERSVRIFVACDVHGVVAGYSPSSVASPPPWRVQGKHAPTSASFAIECRMVVVCTNRRLGVPRELTFEGEGAFKGAIRRGLGSDAEDVDWATGNALIVGMGAYALEHLRTALERGAPRATILCRQRGAVCPQVVDWVNYVRPSRGADFSKLPAGNAVVQMAWLKTYQQSGAKPPECWRSRPRMLKPDGHTVSTSDLFFVAHHLRVADTLLGEVARIERDCVVTAPTGEARGAALACATLIKCVGFHPNESNAALLGRTHLRGIGLVDTNLWLIAEPHLDAGAFALPFGSSYLNQAQFLAKLSARAWRDHDCAARLLSLPCNADVLRFTSTDVFDSIRAAMSASPDVESLLRSHIDEVAARFEAALPFTQYLDRNEVMWRE